MTEKSYKAAWAKIGNSAGYRLTSEFFKEHPEFVGSDGVVQVIAPNTVIFSRQPSEEEDQAEAELMLSLYLNFLTQQGLANPSELEEYTPQMADEDDQLMAGVVLDAD
jgi:antitoxin PrlF